MNPSQAQPVAMAPRVTRRIHFRSDPSSIAGGLRPDPGEVDDLRRWGDMLADSGVDIFQQDAYHKGCTVYWCSDQFQYDPRRQHRRFLPMLDAGIPEPSIRKALGGNALRVLDLGLPWGR